MKMINLNNPNYLLIDEVFPIDYFNKDLRIVASDILIEFDSLRGLNKYKNWIRESGYKQNQENKIILLTGILQLFETEPERALNVIKECNLKYINAKQVEKALNNRLFDMKVERINEEAENKINEQSKKVLTFEEICQPIEAHYKIMLDREITVVKFCAWEKAFNKDIRRKTA